MLRNNVLVVSEWCVRNGRPGLAAWFAAFDARPSMAATRPA